MTYPTQLRLFSLLAILTLLSASCSISFTQKGASTPTVQIITATLPPTLTPRPSTTPLPPTITPTVMPITGVTTTKVNVRSEPNTASPLIGILDNAVKVQITGKDPSGNWLQILYSDSPDGKGWLAATYISIQGTPNIPVVGAGGESESGSIGVIIQKINVRSGPGTDFDSLGVLNPQDVVTLTGKNDTSTWLQIKFEASPDGRGWLASGYVQAKNVETLPIVSAYGEVVGTGTPAPMPPTPTPTLVPAPLDNDSAQAPAISIIFSPSSSRSFSYSSDVSSPEGDDEDWVQITPYAAGASHLVPTYFTLDCTGNGALIVELWLDDQSLDGWGNLICGERGRQLVLSGGQNYLIHLYAVPSTGGLQYVNYILTVQSTP